MQSKGYVESHVEPTIQGAMGRPRRWYRPSAYGRQVFAAWQLAERALDAVASGDGIKLVPVWVPTRGITGKSGENPARSRHCE